MLYLLIASVIWAFSFGLIKQTLAGVDPYFVAFVRMVLSFIIAVSFLKTRLFRQRHTWRLMAIGAVQYGFMYVAYIYSYKYLMAHHVAVFTIFTPIFVAIYSDLRDERKFHVIYLLSAVLAVIGTGIIRYRGYPLNDVLFGFFLMQASNLCFALGQVEYRRFMRRRGRGKGDREVFALLYLGGAIITFLFMMALGDWGQFMRVSGTQILSLFYLGIFPSGICFFLWNVGARRVNAGTLAVMNNLKIPLGVLAALLFFGESADIIRLVLGGVVLAVALGLCMKQ